MFKILKCFLFFVAILIPKFAYPQSGLRKSLERLDKNENGEIDPHEITPLARPYLERIAESHRMSLERSNDIDKLQEAARIYHALKNGVAGKRVQPQLNATVRPFGLDHEDEVIPDFGLAEVEYPYTLEDLEEADRTLGRYDRDDDGYIDYQEMLRAKWTHRDPMKEDYDGDNRLNRLELAQRYARRRLLSDDSDELVQRARRVGNGIRPSDRDQDERRSRTEWYRKGGDNIRLTWDLMERFDRNRNGKLQSTETAELGLPVNQIDTNRDGEITREEMHQYVSVMQDESGAGATPIPEWFFERDSNDDGQVEMFEFASEWNRSLIDEFTELDINSDGFLTVEEMGQSKSMGGGAYRNRNAVVLPPRRTIISEIVIDDEFFIDDLDVKLSITHSHCQDLDAYLVGPNGHQIELFSGVGGHDDNFEETMFDDQSRYPITKARPPFRGTFLPEAVLKRQPSLSSFNEKSIQGVWQLMIRGTRNERFGMLHGWSLVVRPMESLFPGNDAAAVADDGIQPSGLELSQSIKFQRQMATEDPQGGFEKFKSKNLDYGELQQRMEAAVQSGKMTREQVNKIWEKFKSKDKSNRIEDRR